ncbi:hypothetical protein DFH06DRAFT_1136149 [Mycena polygramma]|nr:hypothetical protein DFH06DRAFT_1136149 [Mycena polygramma]
MPHPLYESQSTQEGLEEPQFQEVRPENKELELIRCKNEPTSLIAAAKLILACLIAAWRWVCGLKGGLFNVQSFTQGVSMSNVECGSPLTPREIPPSHQGSFDDEHVPSENTAQKADQNTALGNSKTGVPNCAQESFDDTECELGLDREKPNAKHVSSAHVFPSLEAHAETSSAQFGALIPFMPIPTLRTSQPPENAMNTLERMFERISHATGRHPIPVENFRASQIFQALLTGITGSAASNRLQFLITPIGSSPNGETQNTPKNRTNLYLVKWESNENAASGFVLLQTGREPKHQIPSWPACKKTRQSDPDRKIDDVPIFACTFPSLTNDAGFGKRGLVRTGRANFVEAHKITGQGEHRRTRLVLAASVFDDRALQGQQQTSPSRNSEAWSESEMPWEKQTLCSHASMSVTIKPVLESKNSVPTRKRSASKQKNGIAQGVALPLAQFAWLNENAKGNAACADFAAHQNAKRLHPETKVKRIMEFASSRKYDTPRPNRIAGTSSPPRKEVAIVWKLRAKLSSVPTAQNNAVLTKEIADFKVLRPNKEWRWRATFCHTVGNPGTARTWCGDEQQQIIPASNWKAEYCVAQGNCNIKFPKTEWCRYEDWHYETKNWCMRWVWPVHRTKIILANEFGIAHKGHARSGGRPQYTITQSPNYNQTKLTFKPTTMTNLPLPPKPAESNPGKRSTPSSRGRFVHRPPHIIPFSRSTHPSSRASPSTRPDEPPLSRPPPIPRLLPSAAPARFAPPPTPMPCNVLERRHYGDIGLKDHLVREPNALTRMHVAAGGTLASPQMLYTGGLPAERTGHAEVRLFASPSDEPALAKYGPHLRRERVDEPAKDKPADSPADASSTWRRPIRPIPSAALRRLAAAAAAVKAAGSPVTASPPAENDSTAGTANSASASDPAPMDTDTPAIVDPKPVGASRANSLRFLLHPVDQPPSCDTSTMVRLGNAADNGDNVLVVDGGPRVDTPHLPLRLFNSPPALMPIAEEEMDIVNDGGEEMEGVEGTPTPRLAPSDAPAVTMPAKGAPAQPLQGALVFGAFMSPAPASPTLSTAATHGSPPPDTYSEEEDAKSSRVPPARPSTATASSNEQVESNTAGLAALELDTPRPAALALAAPSLGNAHSSAASPVVDKVLATTPATLLAKRSPSPIDFDDAEFVSSSGSEEGEIKEEKNSPGMPPPSRAARVAIPELGNGKRGPVVTRERFSSSPSFESQPSKRRVVVDLDEREEGIPLRLRKLCVQPRTRPDEAPVRDGPNSWVNVSAVRTTLPRQDSRKKARVLSSSEEDSDSSIPALVSPNSDSEESNDSESYDSFSSTRDVPITNDRGSGRPLSQENDTVLPTGFRVRELAYILDRVTVAPPAPEVDDNARGILLAQAIRRVVDHNTTNRARRVAEDDHTGQPIRDGFEVSLTHARLVLDQAEMATHHEPMDLEDLARRYQDDLRTNIGAATLVRNSDLCGESSAHLPTQTQFTNATLCRVAVPVYGDRFRVSERWATPRTPLGAEFRVFSEWARVQGVVFMTGIGLEVARRPGFVAVISILKICVLEFLRRALRLLLHYGCDLDESILHAPANLPLPFLDGNQNSQLRMVTHALAVSGRGVLAKLASDFMGLRFRDPHLIAFFNYSGMLELVGPDAEHFEVRAMIAASALNITRLTRRNGGDRPAQPQPSPAVRDAPNSCPTASRSAPTRPASPRPTSIPAPRIYYPHGRGHVRSPVPIPRPIFSRLPMPPKPSSSNGLATRKTRMVYRRASTLTPSLYTSSPLARTVVSADDISPF